MVYPIVFCLILDQLTKFLAKIYLKGKVLEVLPFLNFTLVYNRGFVFGFFNEKGGLLKALFYYGIPIALVLTLAVLLLKVKDRSTRFALALITGGGLGNLIDRLFFGKVADFIDFHLGSWHYPTFNVADICVSLGIALLIFRYLFEQKEIKRV